MNKIMANFVMWAESNIEKLLKYFINNFLISNFIIEGPHAINAYAPQGAGEPLNLCDPAKRVTCERGLNLENYK